MPKTFYKATFSNGRIETRSTDSRTYSHCWLVAGIYVSEDPRWNGKSWSRSGWSRTADLARKAIGSECPADGRTFAEVAPAVEIDSREYRSTRAEAA
jgi:hypothetical protein